MDASEVPFWHHKKLHEMNTAEWESLCDGCGKCCLHKLEDEDNGEIFYSSVACKLLDLDTCRCSRYQQRRRWVPDCVQLKAADILNYEWLPETCAYYLLANGQDLPSWHPLVSGDPNSVHSAGISVRTWAISEQQVRMVEDHLISNKP